MRFPRLALSLTASLLAGWCASAPAAVPQSGAPAPPPAPASLERIACASDPSQTYAAALPPGHDPARPSPLVLLMDPRGRAGVPLEIFRAGAARLGYILISSYDTTSDGAWEPNERAVRAMLPDAVARFHADPRRIYRAGFSGTARAAWDFAARLQGGVAGVIGFGAGLPSPRHPVGTPPPFFGGAGTGDFNHQEMRDLDRKLDGLAAPHRIVSFDGPHGWPPAEVASQALEWMELQAMARGLAPRREELVRSLFETRTVEARRRAAEAGAHAAWILWQAVAEDFAGLHDVSEPAARAAALAEDKQVRRVSRRMERLAGRERAYQQTLGDFLARFHSSDPPPSRDVSLSSLGIAPLKAQESSTEDPLEAQAAQRMLALAFVHLSYYEPVACLERRDAARAAAFLQVAASIQPDDPGLLVMTARARAQLGQVADALEALERAASLAQLDPGRLREDPWLAPLAKEPRFEAILSRAP
jgi:predicted esterase